MGLLFDIETRYKRNGPSHMAYHIHFQASAWFLKIDPVRIVGMRVCLCVCLCVRARGY